LILDDVAEVRDACVDSGGCGGRWCVTTRVLATRLGLLVASSSDDVDWSQPDPDLMQYVANASTGRYRVYEQWAIPSPDQLSAEPGWRELVRRGQCVRCLCPHTPSPDAPLCVDCTEQTQTQSDQPSSLYETRILDPVERKARNDSLQWMRAVKHIQRPPRAPQNEDRGKTENELPCVRCARTTYKAAFWYGYRAICNLCLAPELARHLANREKDDVKRKPPPPPPPPLQKKEAPFQHPDRKQAQPPPLDLKSRPPPPLDLTPRPPPPLDLKPRPPPPLDLKPRPPPPPPSPHALMAPLSLKPPPPPPPHASMASLFNTLHLQQPDRPSFTHHTMRDDTENNNDMQTHHAPSFHPDRNDSSGAAWRSPWRS
jgi:hypothetical protein